MKKKIGNIAIGVSILLLGTVYFIADKKLYYYGKNDLHIYHTLPLGIQPEFRNNFDGGFVLWDKYGFALSGNMASVGEIGDSTYQNDITKNIIKYGYNQESLVALIEDTVGNYYYIEYIKNVKINPKNYVSIKVKKTDEHLDFKVNRWIDVKSVQNNKTVSNIILIRNFSFFCCVILILISILIFITHKVKKR